MKMLSTGLVQLSTISTMQAMATVLLNATGFTSAHNEWLVHASGSVQCLPGMAACTCAPVQVKDYHTVTCIAKESSQASKLLHTMWMNKLCIWGGKVQRPSISGTKTPSTRRAHGRTDAMLSP